MYKFISLSHFLFSFLVSCPQTSTVFEPSECCWFCVCVCVCIYASSNLNILMIFLTLWVVFETHA